MMQDLILFTAVDERERLFREATAGLNANVTRCTYPADLEVLAKLSWADAWVAFGDEVAEQGSDALHQITLACGNSATYSLVVAPLSDVQQPAVWLSSFDDWLLEDHWVSTLASRLQCGARTVQAVSESQAQCIRLSAHDINNPLTAIRILSEMLMGDVTDPMLSQDLKDILEASDVAAGMIESLSLYLKMNTKVVPSNLTTCDLGGIIEEVMQRPALRGKVEFRRDEGCCTVQADRSQLRSVVSDVLLNARKMTDGRSIVRVALSSQGDKVSMQCTSVRMSIPDGLCRYLVERYGAHVLREQRFPVAPSALYAAKLLIEAQDGVITFDSGAEGGLQVTCSFPMVRDGS